MPLYHYTDVAGFKAINSQVDWCFRAFDQRGNRPRGAYFTSLGPGTVNLARKLGIPKSKVEYVFCFDGVEGLLHFPGGRGQFILYSSIDYIVRRDENRQLFAGLTSNAEESQQ